MRVVGHTGNGSSITMYILEDEQEVGKVTCTKKFVADMPKDMLFTQRGRQVTHLVLVTVQSMNHRYTGETLLQLMLQDIEDTMSSYNLDNIVLLSKEHQVEDYEKYRYTAIAYSEKENQYLVIKNLK